MARFREQGYDATSVSELTRAAGVAKGTFFNHFPTKEHILASWFRGVWEGEARTLAAEGIGGADAVVTQAVRIVARLEEDAILAGALVARIADLPGGEPGGEDDEAPLSRPLDQVRAWFMDRIRECLPMVVPIREVSDADLSALLVGALVETLREAFLTGQPAAAARPRTRVEARVEARIDFLLASAGLRGV
jgi:AcrR family transcriptional regulator